MDIEYNYYEKNGMRRDFLFFFFQSFLENGKNFPNTSIFIHVI